MAAVVAHDRYVAEDVARSVIVDYESLPVVTDPREALAADAPLLHPDWGTNIAGSFRILKGDPSTAFEEADHIVRIEVSMPRQTGTPIEARGVLARPSADGAITVWSSTQAPHWLRDALVVSLDEPSDRIRVVAPGRRRWLRHQVDGLPGGAAPAGPRSMARSGGAMDRHAQ